MPIWKQGMNITCIKETIIFFPFCIGFFVPLRTSDAVDKICLSCHRFLSSTLFFSLVAIYLNRQVKREKCIWYYMHLVFLTVEKTNMNSIRTIANNQTSKRNDCILKILFCNFLNAFLSIFFLLFFV